MVGNDGKMAFNSLGISFISNDIPKKKSDKVYDKMYEIIEKYRLLAQEEFDKFLESQGLKSAMGIVIKKNKMK